MTKKNNVKTLVILSLMTALLILFSFTPIGTIPIGPLSITLNIIPVAIAAITLGAWGGLAMGCVFGVLSFLQCLGIGVPSGMGVILFGINPFLAFVQRFVPRALDGLLVGLLYQGFSKRAGNTPACFVAGFFSAFLNTLFFMSALVLLFGNTEYVQGLIAGRSILLFVVAFVGVNAVVEMLVSTVVTGLVGSALFHAKLLPVAQKT
ncbi:MAG: ECF transporter S component [Fretibacterium sp.]|nr:ECF transporter S component [Oscillospiraceae bacterium]MBQ9413154.1 ECF transporter S component [Oscillospiraceae bacterium]MBQ9526837.1 ECF transporter S component [Fretibacterium sp.]